jgi:hypothetical protein
VIIGVRKEYLVHMKPWSAEILDVKGKTLTLNGMKEWFSIWKKLVKEMGDFSPAFDDPIEQAYYDDLEVDFEIMDDDANTKPFNSEKQDIINKYLEDVKLRLNEQSFINEDEKNDTLLLIENTQNNLSRSTKKEVIKNIRKIIAKIYKIAMPLGKELLISFTSQVMLKQITG